MSELFVIDRIQWGPTPQFNNEILRIKELPYEEQRIEALALSVEKWRKVVSRILPDGGPTTCACCKLWYERWGSHSCEKCPIYEHTGFPNCVGTPYESWSYELDNQRDYNELLRCAREELSFLETLLEKEHEH